MVSNANACLAIKADWPNRATQNGTSPRRKMCPFIVKAGCCDLTHRQDPRRSGFFDLACQSFVTGVDRRRRRFPVPARSLVLPGMAKNAVRKVELRVLDAEFGEFPPQSGSRWSHERPAQRYFLIARRLSDNWKSVSPGPSPGTKGWCTKGHSQQRAKGAFASTNYFLDLSLATLARSFAFLIP
jgi:hypothetical protein